MANNLITPQPAIQATTTSYVRVLTDCSDINRCSISGTGATVEADTTYLRRGTSSYKVTNASSGNTTLTINVTPFNPTNKASDGSTLDGLGIWVFFPNAVTFTSLVYAVTNERAGGAGTNKTATVSFFEGKYVNTSPITGGWNFIYLEVADLTGGTLDLTDTSKPITAIYIQCIGNASNVWYVDSVLWGCKKKPVMTFTFDDAYSTTYDEIFPVFESLNRSKGLNLKGTIYYCGSLNGTAGYITADQLVTLENAGWIICNHTYSHWNPASYTTTTQVEDWMGDVARDNAFLTSNGNKKGLQHIAYPNGNCTVGTHDKEIKLAGFKSARIINGGVLTNAFIDGPNYPYCLWAKGVTKTVTAANIISILDGLTATANQKNRWMIGYFHKLGTTAEEQADGTNIIWDRGKMYNSNNYLDNATVIGNVANKIIAGTLEHKTIKDMEPYIALSNSILAP